MSEHAIREYLKTIGSGGGGVSEETDPVFTASPAHGISAQDISDWNDKQDELVSGTNIKTINGQSLLGSGDLPVTSKVELEYAGNVSAIHWSSWTAIDDGIVVIDIGWLTNGNFGYYYVKDNTDNFNVGKVTTYTANGTSNTTSFPVLKGHTYQVANQANVDGSHIYFRYYKFKNPTTTCGGLSSKTVSAATDSNGNLSLGLSLSTAKAIISVHGSNYVFIPFVYSNNWYAKVMSSNSSHTSIVSESVSVTVLYVAS